MCVCVSPQHLTDLTRQMGDPLYKSLGNFKLHLDEGRKKEENRAAALAEHQVRLIVQPG